MKKILSLASVLVLVSNLAFAADLPYENGQGGTDDTPTDDQSGVDISSKSGRAANEESESDQGGVDLDPRDLDPTWTVGMARAFQMMGLYR